MLGNSNGKNRGKKYLMRDSLEFSTVDLAHARLGEEFNEWFGRNYTLLVLHFRDKRIFDADTINETYLRIYENILYSGLRIDNYKSYFIRSYYTNYVKDSMRGNRFCELYRNLEMDHAEDDYFQSLEEKLQKLEKDIFDYVYCRYDIREFELFKMYMSLKPAVNYYSLSKITGIKAYNIQYTVSKIKKDLRSNKEFTRRRKELV